MAVVQCLKAHQAGQIIVAEVSSKRREFAQRHGATVVIDPREEDVVAKCKLLCGGQGPNIAFDCAGVAASIKSACSSVRSRGTVVNVAVPAGELPFDMKGLLIGEKRLVAGEVLRWCFAISLYQTDTLTLTFAKLWVTLRMISKASSTPWAVDPWT